MGRYCVCGVKIKGIKVDPNECECNWENWITYNENGILPQPEEDGIYEVRYGDNGGDHNESAMRFQKEPFKIETLPYSDRKIPIHWEGTSWDDYYVYAWKKK